MRAPQVRPFKKKNQFQQLLDSLNDTVELPKGRSGKATKTGLIAAGSLAGLTAASAAISSLRRSRSDEDGS